MRTYTELDEYGNITRRWAELDPVESDGTHWRVLGELIADSGMMPMVRVRDGSIIFEPKGLTALDVFMAEAQSVQARLTSLMDEARRIHRLMALWDRALRERER